MKIQIQDFIFSLYLLLKEAKKTGKSSLVLYLGSSQYEFIFSYKDTVVFINTAQNRFKCLLEKETIFPLEQKEDLQNLQSFLQMFSPTNVSTLFNKHKQVISTEEILKMKQQKFIENLLELRSHYQILYTLFEDSSYQKKACRILSYLRFLEKKERTLLQKKI